MKKKLARIFIACLLAATLILAITRPPQSYYPALEIEANSQSGLMTLGFLFEGRATLAECEALTGNIARTTLATCPQCKLHKLTCHPTLDESERRLLSDAPISSPSGRMSNGAVTFNAADPKLAMAACQATQIHASTGKNHVACYAANTPRSKPAGASFLNIWTGALLLISFIAAWLVGWLIIRYEHLHAHLSHDHIDSGPQKYHTTPTPRIGGLAIMTGLLAASAVMLMTEEISIERSYALLLLAGIPAFLGGLADDVTKKVGVFERLLLTILSGAAAAYLLGAVLNRLDIPGIDSALLWLPLAVIFTAFAVGGIANATNIVDGTNGLAGGYAVIVLTAMAYVANLVGDSFVFSTSIAVIGAVVGFLVWNWPSGKIFMGDGGAYLLGFMLAELAVLLVVHNPAVSPWFPLLLLIYPIFETLYSVYRRKVQHQIPAGLPDNKHMHQLIHDNIILKCRLDGKPLNALERNSRVARYFWTYAIVLAVLGGTFWSSTPLLLPCIAGFCIGYVIMYRRIERTAPIVSDLSQLQGSPGSPA